MSEKKRMTTWVPTIVMGVVAILFSVYALQEQTELQRAQAELRSCQQQLETEKGKTADLTARLDAAVQQTKMALTEAEVQYRERMKKEKSGNK